MLIKRNTLRAASAAAFAALTVVSSNAFAGYVTTRSGSIVHDHYGIPVTDRYGVPAQATAPLKAAATVQPAAPASSAATTPAQPAAFTEVEREELRAAAVNEPHQINRDILFRFDSAALNSEAKDRLQRLATTLKEADAYGIAVVGHSDRIGTPRAKLHVSLERAVTVRDYLVAQGVDPQEIAVVEESDAERLASTAACDGLKGAKLKACLQPDRHVEIHASAWTPAVLIEDTVTQTVEPAAAAR